MKIWLQRMLRCPECLPDEVDLTIDIEKQKDDEITTGRMKCRQCRRTYPIREGVAVLLPDRSRPLLFDESGYNSRTMLSSYLWSHYSEFFNDPEATGAYTKWSSCFKQSPGYALDVGCAVGRLTFELSRTHSRVIGLDTSLAFISQARELLRQERLCFDMITEGLLTEKRSCDLNPDWQYDRVDFIVADALALPFADSAFSTAASINLLEKVPHPRQHLLDINRVLHKQKGRFVFADPFSWDDAVSPPQHWLGGTENGDYGGRGLDNMVAIFQGKDSIFDPPLEIDEQGSALWKIRKTENLWEYIRSQHIAGSRKKKE